MTAYVPTEEDEEEARKRMEALILVRVPEKLKEDLFVLPPTFFFGSHALGARLYRCKAPVASCDVASPPRVARVPPPIRTSPVP